MRENLAYKNNNPPKVQDELLKVTALLYLKEALVNQEYEQCPVLIKTAQRFGAGKQDIRKVIDEYTGRGKYGSRLVGDQAIGGRLRLIGEE